MDMLNMCTKFRGLSLKTGVDIWTFVRKTFVLRSCLYLLGFSVEIEFLRYVQLNI